MLNPTEQRTADTLGIIYPQTNNYEKICNSEPPAPTNYILPSIPSPIDQASQSRPSSISSSSSSSGGEGLVYIVLAILGLGIVGLAGELWETDRERFYAIAALGVMAIAIFFTLLFVWVYPESRKSLFRLLMLCVAGVLGCAAIGAYYKPLEQASLYLAAVILAVAAVGLAALVIYYGFSFVFSKWGVIVGLFLVCAYAVQPSWWKDQAESLGRSLAETGKPRSSLETAHRAPATAPQQTEAQPVTAAVAPIKTETTEPSVQENEPPVIETAPPAPPVVAEE